MNNSLRMISVLLSVMCLIWVGRSNVLAGDSDITDVSFREAMGVYREALDEKDLQVRIARLDDAIGLFDAILSREAFSSRLAYRSEIRKSECLEQQGKYSESLASYSKYLDRLEGARGREKAVAVVRRRGEVCLERRDYIGAIRYFQLALEKYPDDPVRHYCNLKLGETLIEKRSPSRAIGYFQAVIEEDPKGKHTPWAYRKWAFALLLLERYDESMQVLDELALKFPQREWQAYVQYRRGYTLAAQGKDVESLAAYQKVVDDYPQTPYYRVACLHIKQIQERVEQEMLEQIEKGLIKKQDEKGKTDEVAELADPSFNQ